MDELKELKLKFNKRHKEWIKMYNDNVLLTMKLAEALETLDWYAKFNGEAARSTIDNIKTMKLKYRTKG